VQVVSSHSGRKSPFDPRIQRADILCQISSEISHATAAKPTMVDSTINPNTALANGLIRRRNPGRASWSSGIRDDQGHGGPLNPHEQSSLAISHTSILATTAARRRGLIRPCPTQQDTVNPRRAVARVRSGCLPGRWPSRSGRSRSPRRDRRPSHRRRGVGPAWRRDRGRGS
jgi:hypothetical protein